MTNRYEGMTETYGQLRESMDANGYSVKLPVYEFYLNDPQITPPNELETWLVHPVQ